MTERFRLRLYAYVLMQNHFHLRAEASWLGHYSRVWTVPRHWSSGEQQTSSFPGFLSSAQPRLIRLNHAM